MTTETDTLYSSLGEAENHAKHVEAKLAEARLIIDALLLTLDRAKNEGSYVYQTAAYARAVERGQAFIRECGA